MRLCVGRSVCRSVGLSVCLTDCLSVCLYVYVHVCVSVLTLLVCQCLYLQTFLVLRSEYVFNFDNTFELHQDVDILKKMGLDCGLYSGSCTPESLAQAKSQLPKIFEPVLDGKFVQ